MSLCPVTRTQCVCQPDEGFHCPYYPSAIAEARREERDALAADAERYRWLRVKGYLALPELMDADDILHVTHKLDDAIDASMGKTRSKPP